jgi:hypothetical protein
MNSLYKHCLIRKSAESPARKLMKKSIVITTLALCGAVMSSTVFSNEMITVRVSVSTDNNQPIDTDTENYEARPAISDDGRFVVYESTAYNLVENDTNNKSDIFLRDRELQTTVRISNGINGEQANGDSATPQMTGNGRFIVFGSTATNLIANDGNNFKDIFIYDTVNKTTERITQTKDGVGYNDHSGVANISDDGRYIVFPSLASNWVGEDLYNGLNVLLHDRETKSTITTNPTGGGRPNISADGQFICFSGWSASIVPDDTNGQTDIFLYDVTTQLISRVNVASDGTQANGYSSLCSLSADGRYVAFQSDGTTLVSNDTNVSTDIFVHDAVLQNTERVSLSATGGESDSHNNYPSLAKDGIHIVFQSYSTNFATTKQGMSLFTKNRLTGDIRLVSIATDGTNRESIDAGYMHPAISGDGQHVAFQSGQTNLVQDDTNDTFDTFVHGSANFSAELPDETPVETVEDSKNSSGGSVSFLGFVFLMIVCLKRKGTIKPLM